MDYSGLLSNSANLEYSQLWATPTRFLVGIYFQHAYKRYVTAAAKRMVLSVCFFLILFFDQCRFDDSTWFHLPSSLIGHLLFFCDVLF